MVLIVLHEECGRRAEVNQMSTCDLTFDLARRTRAGRGEVNQRCTCGIIDDIWNTAMGLALGWFLTQVFRNYYVVTNTNYTP